MKIPNLTQYNYAILNSLKMDQLISGKEVREKFCQDISFPLAGIEFYRWMLQLERDGVVEGETIEDDRFFRLTQKGVDEIKESKKYYGAYHPVPIAVAILCRENDILLGRRQNIEEHGLYGFPGGKQEYGETIQDTLVREVKEETGLTVKHYRFRTVIDEIVPFGHFLAVMFEIDLWEGELCNTEPAKCAGWEWHAGFKLPPKDQLTALVNLCIGAHIL